MTPGLTQRSLLLLFALSGFSGLIYESVWSHYLKIFLGHAAYAQALVLIIFMGGMAIGAWLISGSSHRIRNLLLAYALVEGIIGVFGLVFHNIFVSVNTLSFETIIPVLESPFLVYLYKVTAASILILPQSILLGTTFPLMCGGFIRKFPGIPGRSVSLLYFSNSIGAAIALLISTFYLVSKFGLPGTIFTAGLLNIAIALFVYAFSKQEVSISGSEKYRETRTAVWPWLFIAASLFTGMASFIYEIAWIRMLSMVLGSSTHSFELMLSAFITGLAIGGFWIRKRIDRIDNPAGFAGIVQIVMGLLAFLTIFLYDYCFEIMSFLVAALDKTNQGYILYNVASHGIALLIMLPATICAGMTLPLFTYILLQQNHGEKSIGLIYSSNTIGAILGVFFTIFVGMPVLGLKNSILSGALIDIIVGCLILKTCIPRDRLRYAIPALSVSLAAFLTTAISYEFDTKRMASGVFRHGFYTWQSATEVLFHKDGKTASISVMTHNNDSVLIATNGKPDASITMNRSKPPTLDEITMNLLSALPLSINPEARTIANIGMGSGLTTHVSLIPDNIEKVDTIEIEEAMVAGARFFIPETIRAFDDPRSNIHIDDARTYFSTHKSSYDIIISEPSNPWVSGVSSLFTMEFYQTIRKHLNEGGIFAQWIHTYEFNLDLLVSVLKSLSSAFPYYSIYFTDTGNIILIAGPDEPIPFPDASIFDSGEMADQLAGIDITNLQDITFRFLGDQELYKPFVDSYPVPANSDYYPILDLRAPKYRFLREEIRDLFDVRLSTFPILDFLYDKNLSYFDELTLSGNSIRIFSSAKIAHDINDMFETGVYTKGLANYSTGLSFLKAAADDCTSLESKKLWIDSLFLILENTAVYIKPEQLRKMIDRFTPRCENVQLQDYQQIFLDFFRSIGNRNYAGIVNLSERILTSGFQLDNSQKKFIYTALIVSLMKTDDYQRVADLWNDEVANVFRVNGKLSLEMRLLLALIDFKIINT